MTTIDTIIARYDAQQVLLLVDECVPYANVLGTLPYPTLLVTVDADTKSVATLTRIWDFLNAHHATRKALLVIIGGGTLSDVGGLAAATYLRGMDYVNVPTTLLAMVDAAIGGKTAINYAGLKNRIGAFHLPKEVVIEPAFLATLPDRQWLSGCGEVIKTMLIGGVKSIDRCAEGVKSIDRCAEGVKSIDRCAEGVRSIEDVLERRETETVWALVRACAEYKEEIVRQDYEEAGLRKVLNFGHTVGHALEEQAAGQMEHGYAVVYGMVAELYLSVVMIGCPRELLTQVTHWMVTYYGRPQCNCKQVEQLIDTMYQDKKNATANEINCTLLRQVGEPVYDQIIERSVMREALDYLFSV